MLDVYQSEKIIQDHYPVVPSQPVLVREAGIYNARPGNGGANEAKSSSTMQLVTAAGILFFGPLLAAVSLGGLVAGGFVLDDPEVSSPGAVNQNVPSPPDLNSPESLSLGHQGTTNVSPTAGFTHLDTSGFDGNSPGNLSPLSELTYTNWD